MKWFKFYGQDYLSDPKMLSLSSSERSCWITLLCYSSVNDDGKITFMSEQQLMLQAGLDFTCDEWERTVGVFEKLKKLQMITIDDGVITVVNWQKRQEINLTGYERTKRYRQNNKDKISARSAVMRAISRGELKRKPCEICGVTLTEAHHDDYSQPLNVRWFCKKHHQDRHHDYINDDAMMTPDKNRIDKKREEKREREEKLPELTAPTPSQETLSFFSKGENYVKTSEWLQGKNIPEKVVTFELNKFITYWTEKNSTGRKERWQMERTFEVKRRLATWLSRVKDFSGVEKKFPDNQTVDNFSK